MLTLRSAEDVVAATFCGTSQGGHPQHRGTPSLETRLLLLCAQTIITSSTTAGKIAAGVVAYLLRDGRVAEALPEAQSLVGGGGYDGGAVGRLGHVQHARRVTLAAHSKGSQGLHVTCPRPRDLPANGSPMQASAERVDVARGAHRELGDLGHGRVPPEA